MDNQRHWRSWENRRKTLVLLVEDSPLSPFAPVLSPASNPEDLLVNALIDRGFAVVDGLVPENLCADLLATVSALDEAAFERAGIGRGIDHGVNGFVRRDEICWLDGRRPATAAYLDWMAGLRVVLNRRLFLGLFDFEAHFARYAPGAFYRTHVDAFRGRSNRVLSTVLYLNPGWCPTDGGELVIYGEDRTTVLERVIPAYGRLAVFLSEEFPHEVLPATRTRQSVAGWFRVNTSTADRVDPPR